MKVVFDTIPNKLLQIAQHTCKASHGFSVLGELQAIYDFRDAIMNRLAKQGWPVSDEKTRYKNGTHKVFESILISTWHMYGDKKARQSDLQFWVSNVSEEAQPYFLTPENLAVLETAIQEAFEETKQKYGDPTIVKHHQRSLTSAFLTATSAKFAEETQETKLCKILKEASATLKAYRKKKGVSSIEFREHMEEHLAKKQWPLNRNDSKFHEMQLTLIMLFDAAALPTSLFIRQELQDETFPPRKPYREAKDFILAHMSDLSAAVKEVAAELDAEIARPKASSSRQSEPKPKDTGFQN